MHKQYLVWIHEPKFGTSRLVADVATWEAAVWEWRNLQQHGSRGAEVLITEYRPMAWGEDA